jgi:ferritin-like metal-binding protein YciE
VRFIPTARCKGIVGLIEEATEIIDATGDLVAIDAALIGAAQRIEHYEIARYKVARSFANKLDLGATASLLGQTLDEEHAADRQLTKLASGGVFSSGINHLAADV